MKIINNKTIQITTHQELKNILENNNNYEYIYLGNNITLESGININENKKKITIDGTYLNTRYKLTGMNSTEEKNTICVNNNNSEIIIKNIDIEYTNIYGVIYVPQDKNYQGIITTYEKITFNGTQLSFNPYGTTKIIDSNIIIKTINETQSQEVCESNNVIIGGKTTITSESTNNVLFYFRNDTTNPSVVFLCKSDITISTDTREFMNGTNKLNFTILHDTSVNLITGNGFSAFTTTGANNVLIDERASLNFIEKSHQRIPMWAIFGTFTMKKGSTLQLINTYESTPSDNYNLHFKGTNCKLILENPKSVAIYTKNSNVIYTDNPLEFKIKANRINMWKDSSLPTNAGNIHNLPDYFWYKNNAPLQIEGIITSSMTSITYYNITTSELKELPDIGNFKFQSKKQLSLGSSVINIHPISNQKNTISGHTENFADVLIKYNNIEEIVSANNEGLFEYKLPQNIDDNTNIEITSNVSTSFIYETRKIKTPYNGELSLMKATEILQFDLKPISTNPTILPKNNNLTLKIVDSRLTSSNWKLYASIDKQPTSLGGYILKDALIFKDFNDKNIILNKTPQLVYTGENNEKEVKCYNLTYSKEKGPLLDLSNNGLEANEEYFADIKFTIQE